MRFTGIIASALVLLTGAEARPQTQSPPPAEATPTEAPAQPPEPQAPPAAEPPQPAAPALNPPAEPSAPAPPPQPQPQPPQPPSPSPAPLADPRSPSAPQSTDDPGALDLVRFSGTTFGWYHAVSTSLLGIDRSYLTRDNDLYTMSFGLTPGYFPIWKPRHKLRVSTHIRLSTNLIEGRDSGPPAEPSVDFSDVPLQVRYVATLFSSSKGGSIGGPVAMRDPTLLGGGDWTTWLAGSGALTFPASDESKRFGLVIAPSLRLALRQQIKLLGSDAPGLTHLLLAVAFGWSHPFRSPPAFVPVAAPPSEDQLTYAFDALVALYGDLQLRSGISLYQTFQTYDDPGSSCAVVVDNGCVDVEPAPTSRTVYAAQFSVSLAYLIIPELAVDIGYSHLGLTIGEDGMRRGLFYGPDAAFNAGLTLSIDRLIQRAAAPGEDAVPARGARLQ